MATNNFQQVRRQIQKAIDAGLEAVGVAVEGQVEELAPVKDGRLKGSITHATKHSKSRTRSPAKSSDGIEHDGSENTVLVGTNVEYAADVEFGTAPHVITPKDAKALFWKGAAHPVAKVNHPGTPAQPFLRAGVEVMKGDIIDIFGTTFRSNLQ